LQPNSPILKSSISITEAKKYFDANLKQLSKSKTMMSTGGSVDAGDEITFEKILNSKEPMWNYAYQKIISTGGALKIPIDFGKVYAVVNSKTKAVVPLSSLNYLMMYKDSLQVVHAEWVVLQPDSSWLYGNRNQYSGKIRVSDWNGKLIKNLSYGKLPSYNAVSLKNKLKASTSPSLSSSDPEPPIFTCITFQRDGGSKCTCVDKSKCDMCDICARTICNIPPPECALCDNPPGNPGGGTGGGVGGGGGGSGGGGASPGDYSPSCNPDPNYVMPTITPPAGTHWILPCNGPGVVPIPVESIPTSPILDHIINLMGITDAVKQNFLLEHNDIYSALDDYLVTNGNSSENKAFVNWAVEYIMENTEVQFHELTEANSLPNSTIFLSNLDVSELSGHPKFRSLVENLPNFLNSYPNILKALSLTTGFTEKKIKELMQPGKGPKVRIVQNLKSSDGYDILGHFDNKTKILEIDNGFINDLDIANTPVKYQGIGLILTIITLHEFVHFGRDANNLSIRMAGLKTGKGSIEAGVYFEDIIMPPGASTLEPATASGWLKYYKITYRE